MIATRKMHKSILAQQSISFGCKIWSAYKKQKEWNPFGFHSHIFAKTKPARDGLKAQKSPKAREAYRQAHESDFIIADAAARYFREHGITKLPTRKALQDEIEQLVSEKDGLYNGYREQKRRFAELQTVKRNIDQILRREEPHRRKEQSHER